MKSIIRKLNKKDGVSIIIALFGFLVAAMVAVVIVTAAVSSARSVADDYKTTQTRLTLESAAQLIEKEVELASYTVVEVTNSEGTSYEYYSGTTDDLNDSVTNPNVGPFGQLLLNAAKAMDGIDGSAATDQTGDFTISVSDMNDKIKDVSVNYVMQADDSKIIANTNYPLAKYDLRFTLSIKDDTSSPTLYVYMQRNEVSTETYDDYDWVDGNYVFKYTETTTTYSWKLVSIQNTETIASN